jgi:hypothetical protein
MTDAVRLRTATTPPMPVDNEVVAQLEQLLVRAKAGEFNGLCVVTVTSPGVGAYTACGTGWWGEAVAGGVHIALGGIAVLQERLLRDLIHFSP